MSVLGARLQEEAMWMFRRLCFALLASAALAGCGGVFDDDDDDTASVRYSTSMTGPAESPPNDSPATGTATVDLDTTAHTMTVNIGFIGLQGTSTVAHIHCCTLPTAAPATTVPSFPDFPQGVTSGNYSRTFDTLDAATWNPAFVAANGGTTAGAEAAFKAALDAGNTAYVNIHSSQYGGGEIRGFLNR
jgi:hypothetical protein